MTTPDDLLTRAVRGDSAAFLTLVEKHVSVLHLFILRQGRGVLGADCDADDLLQATLCKAWELIGTFASREPGAFHRWLVSLASHQIGNRLHYLKAKGRRSVEPLPSANPSAMAPDLLDSITSVVSQAARREALARADAALADMPAPERQMVELTYLEGLTIRAAAERAGISRAAAFRALHSGMARLRKVLDVEQGSDQATA
jgi:RNA polymerase sigma factor (sigma-70 family)